VRVSSAFVVIWNVLLSEAFGYIGYFLKREDPSITVAR